MAEAETLSGKKIRIILTNNFHYSGKVVSDDGYFLILIDKFGREVRIAKNSILSLEVCKND